jgi:glyoxylase I family protein
MKPLGSFHHVALTVSDLDRSADWYTRILGMLELFREDGPIRRAAVYRFEDGGTSVGLVEYAESANDAFDPTVNGLDHLAFSVDSPQEMRAWAAHLERHGVAHSGPIEVPPGEILQLQRPGRHSSSPLLGQRSLKITLRLTEALGRLACQQAVRRHRASDRRATARHAQVRAKLCLDEEPLGTNRRGTVGLV